MRRLTLMLLIPALLGAQDDREIVRHLIEADRKNAQLARQQYTYVEREEQNQLDTSGKIKESDVRTWDVMMLEGSMFKHLVAHNDKPLTAKEQKQEDERLRKRAEQRRKETPEERERAEAERERRAQKQHESMEEILNAFDFKLEGEEALNGGQTYVIAATPRPGYKPKSKDAMAPYFSKMKGRMWIDKSDYEWVKVEAETLDTISIGGFLIRMAKGGRLTFEQTRVNDEVWLPKSVSAHGAVRIALVKVLRGEIVTRFSDYKKFTAESRVLPATQ